MSLFSKHKLLATAALTASAAGLFVTSASAAPEGSVTLSPTSGTSTTPFSMALPSGASCSGPGTAGYFWTTYLLPASANPETYNWTGGTPNAPSGQFGSSLFDSGGNTVDARAASAPAGQITGIPAQFSLEFFAGNALLTAGAYNIGYACTNGSSIDINNNGTPANTADDFPKYWQTPITISNVTASNFNWSLGAPPIAPAPITAVGGNQSISGTVTRVTATPAVTGYQITATPVGGGTSVSVNVAQAATGPIPYTITGLTNGTTYNVTAIAANAAGDSAPVAPPVQATPSLPIVTPAPVVSVASGPSPIAVSWVPSSGSPLSGATLVSHTVTLTPVGAAAPIAPITVPAGTNTTSVTGAAGDGYNVTVVGNYSNGQVTAPGLAAFSFTNAQVVVQDITTVRPQGALVLTQRCGVHGSAPAYSNALFGPTFPALDQTPGADPDGANAPAAVGTAPRADALPNDPNSLGTGSVGPVGNTTAAGQPDGLFPQYPYPVDASGNAIATYPTNCAINLGTSSLITSGPSAGAYFRATGRIAQLTVVDTRDSNPGWTLNGRMGNFSNGTDSFSGNLLGWVPEVTWDSNPNLDGYDTDADAGTTRLPQPSASTTGLGAASNSTNTTLANSLAKANVGAGLGMAVMDARINLLIPVTADAGTYKGVLTFTIV